MYEVHALVWPFVYGLAGQAHGERLGFPRAGAALGAVLGLATAVPLLAASAYEVAGVGLLVGAASFLVPQDARRWLLLGACVLPWAALAVSSTRARRRGAKRE